MTGTRKGFAGVALPLAVAVFALAGLAQAAVASPRFSAPGKKQVAASEHEPGFKGQLRKVTLAAPLLDPMELAVAGDGRVLYVERGGRLGRYDPVAGRTRELGNLPVFDEGEHGLIGLALDPRFATNGWIYLTYSRASANGVDLRVSRFKVTGNALDASSEKHLLSIPTHGGCCHEAGSLSFGPGGDLYVSTGDDTFPFASNGYAPIDERPGRSVWDAQKSASNTNDLRGKILRIRPSAAGGYTIPAGNLFPGGRGGRPEIYAMGLRNPLRFSIDARTGSLYFGDAGPDAPDGSALRGPRGYDEINRTSIAGNFGWPYCIAGNEPYVDYDFATGLSGQRFSCARPVNDSPNNTGASSLPGSRPALLWYPYDKSRQFPKLGKGSRTALAGPVYRRPSGAKAKHALPDQYEGDLFTYDWARSWIKTVRFDERGQPEKIYAFGKKLDVRRPIDMELGADGSLYVLEWGLRADGENDSGLYRIDFRR